MASFMVINYDISDPDLYAKYNPGSVKQIMETLVPHDGKLIFGGHPESINGSAPQASVCIRFPTDESARAWLDDPVYAPLLKIRLDSTTNVSTYVSQGPD